MPHSGLDWNGECEVELVTGAFPWGAYKIKWKYTVWDPDFTTQWVRKKVRERFLWSLGDIEGLDRTFGARRVQYADWKGFWIWLKRKHRRLQFEIKISDNGYRDSGNADGNVFHMITICIRGPIQCIVTAR